MKLPHRAILFTGSATSAVLLALACPPPDWGWLAWFALAPFFWALLQLAGPPARSSTSAHSGPLPAPRSPLPTPRSPLSALRSALPAGALGFLWGFVFLLVLVPWFAAFSPIGYLLAAGVWGGLAGGMSVVVVALIRRLGRGWAPPLLAAGFTLFEWLRAQGPLAFPWGTVSSTQYRYLPVLQVLDLTGAYGLTFLMVLLSASLAAIACAGKGERRDFRRAGLGWGIAAMVLELAFFTRGLYLLSRPPHPSATARVAVVQASRSARASSVEVVCTSNPEDYAAATREAIQRGAELVVWPEAVSPGDLLHSPQDQAWVARVLQGSGAYLLAGSFVEDPRTGDLTNSAVLLSPHAQPLGRYDKVLIVPFGEYLPARPLFWWMERLGVSPKDVSPGRGFIPVRWPMGKIGPLICYESAFGYAARTTVQRGASLLAVMTSDGWAGRDAVGYQHRAFAALRAVENRRAIARAAATGISQLLDPYGRPLQELPMFQQGVAVADLPLREDKTLYTRLGDWPVLLSGLLLLVAALLVWGPRRSMTGTLTERVRTGNERS